MTKLLALRSQLTQLRHKRQLARWGMAYAALALAALWALVAAFGVDYTLVLTRLQRVVMLVAFVGVMVWAARRFALPWFGHRENDLDMALMVEKHQKIDSDLVAALQFETPEAKAWGSTQLEGAVVDYVAEFGKSWNILEGFSRTEMSRRAMLLAATVVALVVLTIAAPRYVTAFLNRFLLGSAHYPSATEIDRVLVNGREIDITPGQDAVFKAPYGRPLKIVVLTSGVKPRSGHADMRTLAAGMETRLELEPSSNVSQSPTIPANQAQSKQTPPATSVAGAPAATGAEAPQDAAESKDPALAKGAAQASATPEPLERGAGVYSGQLPKLTDSLACQLYFGDAWTDPVRLLVVPLPVVEPRMTPIPPPYARNVAAESTSGSRQLSVVEGSSVEAKFACGNKRLEKAWLVIDKVKYDLAKKAADPAAKGGAQGSAAEEIWTLTAKDTPLARIDKPLRWEAQVVDEDGLSLEHPLEGFIRIKADQRPRIAADVVTKFVLPTAGPRIEYRATDDFGLSKLLVRLEKVSQDGSVLELPPLSLREMREPVLADHLPLKDNYRLELSPLKLVKGDQLKVVLEAVDYRGSAPGQATQSEPLVLQVTDESGVLAAISEADERSARQLDAIITRQLGIGDQK